MARRGKIDPVIGRADEIRRVMQVLSRRTKNNPIVEGLARRIISGDINGLLARLGAKGRPRIPKQPLRLPRLTYLSCSGNGVGSAAARNASAARIAEAA